MKSIRKKKPFCKYGHEIAVCGRNPFGNCLGCYADKRTGPRAKKQFCKRGHDVFKCGRTNGGKGNCKDCQKEDSKKSNDKMKKWRKEFYRKYYLRKKKEIDARNKKWNAEHKLEIRIQKRKYRKLHEKHLKAYARRRRKHKRMINRIYRKAHPEVHRLALLKSDKKRKKRIVKFGQVGIKQFYAKCPRNKTVDHIIPLQGKKVSGLHVSWNLQYLTKSQNSRKGIQVDLLKISRDYGKLLKKLGLK